MTLRAAVLMLLIATIAVSTAFAAAGLTLHDCIDKALTNHPALRAAQEGINAGKGRVTQAGSPYLPQVQASTGYAENRSLGGALGESATKSYTTTLSVNQVIYDFGKTGGGLDAARSGVQSAEWDADRVKQEVVLNVKQAYYALLQANKLLTVAQQTLDQTDGHLRQAEAFFRAGSKPRFDVTRAEVDVNTARLGLINAKNDVRLRTIALYNAMGIDPAGDIAIEDIFIQPAAVSSLDQVQREALEGRSDLLKTAADIHAAQARIRAAESNYLPTLSANGSYNWAHGTTETTLPAGSGLGELHGDIRNSWNAGVLLSMPLFEGGLTKGKVSEARANLRALEAQRDGLRQSILLEVNQAYADLDNAAARISVMESSRLKAKENLDLAEGRYQAGVGPSLEVTDAQVAYIRAETDHVQALYDYQLAASRLMKAMGRAER
jgi:TolC family type I secretion outer membrane protein